ncbi:hypothetical protein AKJ16_DCAP07124 [Drosera capensis]
MVLNPITKEFLQDFPRNVGFLSPMKRLRTSGTVSPDCIDRLLNDVLIKYLDLLPAKKCCSHVCAVTKMEKLVEAYDQH